MSSFGPKNQRVFLRVQIKNIYHNYQPKLVKISFLRQFFGIENQLNLFDNDFFFVILGEQLLS